MRFLLFLLCLTGAADQAVADSAEKTRFPIAAGVYYPSSAEETKSQVDALLAAARGHFKIGIGKVSQSRHCSARFPVVRIGARCGGGVRGFDENQTFCPAGGDCGVSAARAAFRRAAVICAILGFAVGSAF